MIWNMKTEGRSLMCHLMIKIKCENEQERKKNEDWKKNTSAESRNVNKGRKRKEVRKKE